MLRIPKRQESKEKFIPTHIVIEKSASKEKTPLVVARKNVFTIIYNIYVCVYNIYAYLNDQDDPLAGELSSDESSECTGKMLGNVIVT